MKIAALHGKVIILAVDDFSNFTTNPKEFYLWLLSLEKLRIIDNIFIYNHSLHNFSAQERISLHKLPIEFPPNCYVLLKKLMPAVNFLSFFKDLPFRYFHPNIWSKPDIFKPESISMSQMVTKWACKLEDNRTVFGSELDIHDFGIYINSMEGRIHGQPMSEEPNYY